MEKIKNLFKVNSKQVPEINHRHQQVVIILLIVEFILLSFMSDTFFTTQNLSTVTRNFMENGIITLGMAIVIIAGGIDLSVGAMAALGAVSLGIVNQATSNILLAAFVGIIVCLICGCFNGFVVGYLKIPSFIATLATSYLFRGIATGISGASSYSGIPTGFTKLGMGMVLGLPTQLWIFIVCIIIISFMLNRTVFGRRLRIVGFNQKSAHYSGINVPKTVFLTFVVQGALVAVAMLVMVARLASARSSFGMNYELNAITAVVFRWLRRNNRSCCCCIRVRYNKKWANLSRSARRGQHIYFRVVTPFVHRV